VEHLPSAAANAAAEHAERILRLALEVTGIRVGVMRVGETIGTEFAIRGMEVGVMPHELWFRRGLLRHNGVMVPDNVADAMVAMVSLPPTHHYEVVSVIPAAPVGDMPITLAEWQEGFLKLLPS
jgi:hypothetical protein